MRHRNKKYIYKKNFPLLRSWELLSNVAMIELIIQIFKIFDNCVIRYKQLIFPTETEMVVIDNVFQVGRLDL